MTSNQSLVEHIEARVRERGEWTLRTDEFWCHLSPKNHAIRGQGWKLHVSATVVSAPDVLDRALEVVLGAACACKFAHSIDRVRELNSARYPRGGAGKFMTVYPADDDQLRLLARQLHEVTSGLSGPAILSDRRYAPGSLVHYRYGGFTSDTVLGNDGQYTDVITAPDGSKVEDRREAWFVAPEWARDPFDGPETDTADVDSVLLGDRFLVRRAIRHANKGGVFEATDITTHAEVIVKQARAAVGDGPNGWNVQVALRNEAEMLDRLAPLGVAPRRIEVFEKGGDLFLVTERIAGSTLRDWRSEQHRVRQWRSLALRLTDLVASVHTAGVLLRDISPMNVMVRPDLTMTVVDLEYAAEPGAATAPVFTPGYAAPEQIHHAITDHTTDRFALGALLFLLCTGADPDLPPDDHPARPMRTRLADLLDDIAADNDVVAQAKPMLLGLLHDDPDIRWDLDRVRRFLTERTVPQPKRPAPRHPDLDRRLDAGIDHLIDTMTPDDPQHLWPPSKYGTRSDPLSVYHGAAGVLHTLTRAAHTRASVTAAVATAAAWIIDRLNPDAPSRPGLYFGRSGTAIALIEAGKLLEDKTIQQAGADLFDRIPSDWTNPDITHGLAGAGYAALMLWSTTGVPSYRDRAAEYASHLTERAERRNGELLWPMPTGFDDRLTGRTEYGFAHGTAGIATFLLDAGRQLNRPEWIELAAAAAHTLCAAGVDTEAGARWPARPNANPALYDYWCSGSAGIGTFLVRQWHTSGDDTALHWADRAAEAVWARRWSAGPSQCHGLAGAGELLLDLAAYTGNHRYLDRANDIALALAAKGGIRCGRLLAADETLQSYAADYAVGIAGWVEFLLRLRDGGHRAWLLAD
ncbi:class IV lanthionine synthetase LanL [Nocardia sp. NPDC005998]|uniref:class IV lanthionine synthetase LanL n=1 Tax=Nocardia sp. NPDC005998 TaxID=3156894 RepID=UPI0033B5CD65